MTTNYVPSPSTLPPGSIVDTYLRDSGGEKQDRSVARQLEAVQLYCAQYKLKLRHVFEDIAQSGGSTAGRDDFDRMIASTRNEADRPHGLLLWNYARFARDLDDSTYYKALLRSKRGIIIHSLTDPIPEGPYGRFVEILIDISNEEKRRQTSIDAKDGIRSIVAQGAVPGVPPRGIKREPIVTVNPRTGEERRNHRWVPDPKYKGRVLKAFQMRASGASLNEIQKATQLFSSVNSYATFFRNKIYMGTLEYGGMVFEKYCDAMVPRQVWEKVQIVQAKFAQGQHVRSGSGNHPRQSLPNFLLRPVSTVYRCYAVLKNGNVKIWTRFIHFLNMLLTIGASMVVGMIVGIRISWSIFRSRNRKTERVPSEEHTVPENAPPKSIVRSSRRLFWWISLFGTIFFMLGVGVLSYLGIQYAFPREVTAPDAFPDTDLVFTPLGQQVGFVNADGSDLEYVPLVIKAPELSNRILPSRPVITGDNKTLIVKASFRVTYASLPEWLVVSQPGRFPVVCRQWSSQHMAYLSADQQEIFTFTMWDGLQRYKRSNCGKEESPLETYERNLYGIPSPDQKYIVHVRETGAELEDDHLIIVREFSGTKEWKVGIGDYPAWSRDSQWVAYTGKDGIYVVNVLEDREAQLVVAYSYPYPDNENYPVYETDAMWKISPEVAWSPDGNWLVYHKWKGDRPGNFADPTDYAIYKLNIATGEEIMIVDEGIYPYWRWPAAEP